MGPEDIICSPVEAVLFDDTLREIEGVVKEDLSKEQTISVNSVEMYEVNVDFRMTIRADRTAHVDTKYKTMERKVRPIETPLPKDRWEQMKGVATGPRL